MKVSVWKDNRNNLEMYPIFVISNKTIETNIEIESRVYELLINCPIEERNKKIQEILDDNKNKQC